jgi:energy-coupling factor transporter ATP-binding protein EcfA2
MQTRLPILHETLLSYDIKTREVLAINEEAYTALSSYLSKENVTKTAQPNLIVGEPGCGKTFLMKRLYGIVKENMGNTLHPIVIEGKSLFSTDDIWNQCALYLNIECGNDSYDAILKWQETNSKRVVLFVDNVQYYFERTDNTEQYGLRGKLNRSGAPIIIASSEKVLPAFTDYDAAFFDGFKITYLKPLTISAVKEIKDDGYDINRLEKIMAYMPKTVRSMFIAMGILDKSEGPTNDLAFLSDYFFSHYQEKFDVTSTQTQRILSALSQSDSGFTLSEIREITGQGNGKISPYLKLMIDQKLISKEAKTSRGGIYSIIDPLFKLWLRHNTVTTSKNGA